jgi:hypothetical protein
MMRICQCANITIGTNHTHHQLGFVIMINVPRRWSLTANRTHTAGRIHHCPELRWRKIVLMLQYGCSTLTRIGAEPPIGMSTYGGVVHWADMTIQIIIWILKELL